MKLTNEQYRDLIKKHPHLADTGEPAKLEQDYKNEPVEPYQVKEGNIKQGFILVTDVRKRLLDDDNLCEKFHIDALRYQKIIAADSTTHFRISTSQRKCTNQEEPHTLIEIY